MIWRSKTFLVVETLLLVVFPLVVLAAEPSLLRYRTLVMAFALLYVALLVKAQGFTPASFGLTTRRLLPSLQEILLPTLGIIVLLIGIVWAFPDLLYIKEVAEEEIDLPTVLSLLLYLGISVPLQEFIFRGFYINRLSLVSTNKLFLLLHSSAVFTLIHTPFENKLLAVGTFFLGLWWSWVFLKFRNIYPLILSHGLIGSVVILETLVVARR